MVGSSRVRNYLDRLFRPEQNVSYSIPKRDLLIVLSNEVPHPPAPQHFILGRAYYR